MATPEWQSPQEWSDWSTWLAAGLHGRCRWRLPILLLGILFAQGRRTVSSWLRAAGVSDDFADYYYFIGTIGRKAKPLATRLAILLLRHLPLPERVLVALDDSPTKRYGPKVQGADVHRNPTPGPADQKYLYGHIWVTVALVVRHRLWGTIGLPLRAMLYVRQRTVASIPEKYRWHFQTKLQLAAKLIGWLAPILHAAGKRVWIVVDGGYAKRPFLKPAAEAGVVVVGRLRKDAALRDLPPKLKKGQRRPRGRPRKYGKNRISLAKRAGHKGGWQMIECELYGEKVTKTYKTFLATYAPAAGVIRVVLVQEENGWVPFFCTDPQASVREILEAYADRAAIEQDFHDLKEVWGTGQQQVRNIWANLGVFHLNLWMHTLVELWAWNKPKQEICDRRESPWDDPSRRPSHADRRKALRRTMIETELSTINRCWWLPRKILRLTQWLAQQAV
jgi:hypothetical protein